MESSESPLLNRFPDAKSIFNSETREPRHIIDDCLVVVDTNVLLAPYSTGSKGISELKKVYTTLARENRLLVPAHVAKEFAKNRSDKIRNIHQRLQRRKSEKPSLVKSQGDDPVVRELEGYNDLEESTEAVREAWNKYNQALESLIDQVRAWNWNDPVTKMYSNIFKDNIIVELNETEVEVKEEYSRRVKHKVPPGYKDSGKDDNREGDLIVWLTLLQVAASKGLSAVFVTDDSKSDWWVGSEGVVLCPRFELVNEFTRRVDGASFHILQIGEFLRLFGVEEDVVEDLEKDTGFESVSRNVFTKELRKLEKEFESKDDFVSLNYLVRTHLGEQGYQYASSYDMADKLWREGEVELYKQPNPKGEHATTAIRLT